MRRRQYEDYSHNDFYDEASEKEHESRPRDAKIDEAKEAVRGFFAERTEEAYYMKQLDVFFEKEYFHWITSYGIAELLEEGFLKSDEVPLREATRLKFVFNRKYRYHKRKIGKMAEIVRKYSDPDIAIACGRQAEVLFMNGLAGRGFLPRGENVKAYGNRKWKLTGHNLDFILEKDGMAYGCEVKNTFDYIDLEEMKVKLEICDFLGITPLFIMRWAPKSYMWEIHQRVGFGLLYEKQIYPFGQKALVKEIEEELGLPVDSPRAIPEGILERFDKWHRKRVGL